MQNKNVEKFFNWLKLRLMWPPTLPGWQPSTARLLSNSTSGSTNWSWPGFTMRFLNSICSPAEQNQPESCQAFMFGCASLIASTGGSQYTYLINIMHPLQSLLPNIDQASLNVITGRPYQVRLANGYITSIQVNLKPRSLSLVYSIYSSRKEI